MSQSMSCCSGSRPTCHYAAVSWCFVSWSASETTMAPCLKSNLIFKTIVCHWLLDFPALFHEFLTKTDRELTTPIAYESYTDLRPSCTDLALQSVASSVASQPSGCCTASSTARSKLLTLTISRNLSMSVSLRVCCRVKPPVAAPDCHLHPTMRDPVTSHSKHQQCAVFDERRSHLRFRRLALSSDRSEVASTVSTFSVDA